MLTILTFSILFLLISQYSITFILSAEVPQLLAFTKVSSGAYRHDSIPTAVDVITRLGNGQIALNEDQADSSIANNNFKWNVTQSDDDSLWVNDPNYLSQFDAIVFVMTADKDDGSTSVLSDSSKEVFAKYIQNGGGFMGIHVACGCLYDTPFYGRLIGAFFDHHPEIQPVGIKALTNQNPSTSKFPISFEINEEVYHYRTDVRELPSKPLILLTNSTIYNDQHIIQGNNRSNGPPPQPLAWAREGNLLNEPDFHLGQGMDDPINGKKYTGGPGRSFYTSLGHLSETWEKIPMQAHIGGGIAWVLQSPTSKTNKQRSTSLKNNTSNSASSLQQRNLFRKLPIPF